MPGKLGVGGWTQSQLLNSIEWRKVELRHSYVLPPIEVVTVDYKPKK